MISTTSKAAIGSAFLFSAIASPVASASPMKTVVKDGKTHTVVALSSPHYRTTSCGGMSAGVLAEKPEDAAPNITATIGVNIGGERKAFRLYDVAKDDITPEHDVTGIIVGCLTENGGIGIYVPHESSLDEALSIQIDRQGHVFLGYDQTGLMLRAIKR